MVPVCGEVEYRSRFEPHPGRPQRAAKQMLRDGDRRSDRAIAADCGIDHKTVAKLRDPDEESEPGGENPHLDSKRIGRDGKTYQTPAKPAAGTSHYRPMKPERL